jgi:hypothetical protein
MPRYVWKDPAGMAFTKPNLSHRGVHARRLRSAGSIADLSESGEVGIKKMRSHEITNEPTEYGRD